MTDHVARPERAASFPRVDELRQLDRDAYQTAEARRREQNHRDDVHGLGPAPPPPPPPGAADMRVLPPRTYMSNRVVLLLSRREKL
jgi:hypothetical protein